MLDRCRCVLVASVALVGCGGFDGGFLMDALLWSRFSGCRLMGRRMMRRFGEQWGRQERQSCKRQKGLNGGVQTHHDLKRRGTPEHLLP